MGPQYLTLNGVLMSLEYDLYHHSSCYSAYAVVIKLLSYTHIAIISKLFPNILI